MPRLRDSARTSVAMLGLVLASLGTSLLLFPKLPAFTDNGVHRVPSPSFSFLLTWGGIVVGILLMLWSRVTEPTPTPNFGAARDYPLKGSAIRPAAKRTAHPAPRRPER